MVRPGKTLPTLSPLTQAAAHGEDVAMPLIQQGALQQLMSAYTRGASASQVCGGWGGGGLSPWEGRVPFRLSAFRHPSPSLSIPHAHPGAAHPIPPPYT